MLWRYYYKDSFDPQHKIFQSPASFVSSVRISYIFRLFYFLYILIKNQKKKYQGLRLQRYNTWVIKKIIVNT